MPYGILLAQEAHRKLRQRAKVQHRFSRKLTQFRAEHFSIVLIGAHHAGEVLSIERAVERDNRERIVSPALIERMFRR